MKKKILITTVLIIISLSAYCQIKVHSNGQISLGTTTPQIYRQVTIKVNSAFSGGLHIDGTLLPTNGVGIRTNVINQLTTSYNLSVNGIDRFFVGAQGYVWCLLGKTIPDLI